MKIVFLMILAAIHWTKEEPIECTDSRCHEKIERCDLKPGQKFLEVMPGSGWDNLINEERGLTTNREVYELCRLSADAGYLIPDDMTIEPTKSSWIELSSEVFAHFTNYTTLTAYSMSTGSESDLHFASISGDFSLEKESVRKAENSNDGITVRSQLRHRQFVVNQLPDSQLHPRFRNRLMDIAAHLARVNITTEAGHGSNEAVELFQRERNENLSFSPREGHGRNKGAVFQVVDSLLAAYLADLLVRDFGTHTIVSVEVGAVVAKIDSLMSSSRKTTSAERLEMKTAASAAFAGVFGLKTSMAIGAVENSVEGYKSKIASSTIVSHGGSALKASDMNFTEWETSLPENLVAIDRRGRPIYDLITPRTLPELSESQVFRLAGVVRAATERYYAANAVIGCLDPTSAAYDSEANVPSDHCDEMSFHDKDAGSETTQLPFGGVYTVCEGPQDLCSQQKFPNLATGNTSCPEGYQSVRLLPPQIRACAMKCEGSGWFEDRVCVEECAITHAFWCAIDPLTNSTKRELGFLFGGLYTDKSVNPITNTQSCPLYYEPQPLGRRLRVCVSTDREFGRRYSLAFGGFYACQSGNPLIDVLSVNTTTVKKLRLYKMNLSGAHTTGKNFSKRSILLWPKRCPDGYTSHLASVEDTCMVNYCLPAKSMKTVKERRLKRPPFVQLPDILDIGVATDVARAMDQPLRLVDSLTGRIYYQIRGDWVQEAGHREGDTRAISPTTLICTLVIVTMALLITTGGIAYCVYKRISRRRVNSDDV